MGDTKMPEGSVNVNGTKLEPVSGGIARLLFGGGDKKKVYSPVKFNPDGSLANIKAPQNSKTYRKAASLARSYQDFLPALTKAQAESNAVTSRLDAENQLKLLQQLGPDFANQNVALDRIAQLGQAQTGLDLVGFEKLADPEFFKLRELIGKGGADLISGQDPNQLTEQEIANLELIQNRNNIGQGTANTGSPLAAVKAGMTFGDRLESKRNTFANTLSTLGAIAPNLRSSTFSTNSGAGLGAQSQIGGAFNRSSSANQIGNQAYGANASNQQLSQQIAANKPSDLQQAAGLIPDY